MWKEAYLKQFGDVSLYSPGSGLTISARQLEEDSREGKVVRVRRDGVTVVTQCQNGKWFLDYDEPQIATAMLGAACGDIAGSVYEFHNIKRKLALTELIRQDAKVTDDTVMTCAVAYGLRTGLAMLPEHWMKVPAAETLLNASVENAMLVYGHRYPTAGYGGNFHRWLSSADPRPYNSWGNGSAMRVSYAGWVARSLEEAEKLGEITSKVTHNHPEGIKGARVIAGSIFLLRCHADKEEIRQYASRDYDLNFSLDEIRPDYTFDVSCAGSVPQAIKAFLEGEDFADVISLAISIGGDSDTIAAIAGSLAETIYPMPKQLHSMVIARLDQVMRAEIAQAVDFFYHRTNDVQ